MIAEGSFRHVYTLSLIHIFTYGAYLGLTLLTSLALTDRLGFAMGVLVLALMVMGLVAVLGAILERAAYRPLRQSPRLSAVVSALSLIHI